MDLSELLTAAKAPPARGRRKKEPFVVFDRDLDEADIQALWDLKEGGMAAVTPPLKKLRDRHHHLARVLAAGAPPAEAALITGYQQASISILQNDPAFKELLQYYSSQKEQIFIDFHEKLKQLGITCFQEIMDRLEERPEDFSNEEIKDLLVIASDRIGHGPSKSISGTLAVGVVTSEHLMKIKGEVSKRQNGTVERLDKKDNRLEMGGALIQKSLAEEAQVLEPSEEGSGV